MKAFATARWGGGYQSVYLLSDRIEMGSMTSMYVEELSRVAYRDVRVVTTWRTRRPLRLFWGWLLIASGIALGAVMVATVNHPTWIAEPILLALGVATIWWGREGSVLRFRIEGTHGVLDGAIVGSFTKQERFVAELRRQIEQLNGGRAPRQPAG